MATVSKRDQLIDTAADLFYRDGFNATGIEKILAESNVSKMTLYKHFKSKEELIQTALRRRDERFRDWLMNYVETNAATPRDRLLALFDAHFEWFSLAKFRGCIFLNAAAEFTGNTESVGAIANEHKRLLTSYIRGLASAAKAGNPDRLADWFMILLDGAISAALVSADPTNANKAKAAAEVLLDTELHSAA